MPLKFVVQTVKAIDVNIREIWILVLTENVRVDRLWSLAFSKRLGCFLCVLEFDYGLLQLVFLSIVLVHSQAVNLVKVIDLLVGLSVGLGSLLVGIIVLTHTIDVALNVDALITQINYRAVGWNLLLVFMGFLVVL